MAELALKNWRGAERVLDRSFYSHEIGEQGAASADIFLADALRAFRDPDSTLGSPWDRGVRLAALVGLGLRWVLPFDARGGDRFFKH